MAIDPRIPLSVKVPNIADARRKGVQERQRSTTADLVIQKRRSEIEKSEGLEEIKRTGTYARDTVLPLLRAGRTDDLKSNLLERIDSLTAAGKDANGSRKALQLLQEGNIDELQRVSQNIVGIAQDNNLLGNRVKQVTNERGQIVAQREENTGKESVSPRAGSAIKGDSIEVQDKTTGDVFFAVEASDGRIVDAVTGKHLPNVRKAASRAAKGKAGDFRTTSQKGKDKQDSLKAEVSVRQTVTNMNNLRDLVASDDFVGGVSGQAISLINSAAAQVRQVSGTDQTIVDGKINTDLFSKSISKETLGRFRRAAITSDRFDSAVVELAFLIAKSLDPAGRISDKDIDAAEKIIGSGADKASRLIVLDDLMNRTVQRFNISEDVRNPGREKLTVDGVLGRKEKFTEVTSKSVDDLATQILSEEFGP